MKSNSRAPSFQESSSGKIRVAPSRLKTTEHGALLCYPGADLRSFNARVNQLKKLGVKELIFEGDSKVGRFGVVGKGCVSIVVKALLKHDSRIAAIKIRRVDANRPGMRRDFELQKIANLAGVGPEAIAFTKDLFLMEYIDSVKLGKWFAHLKTRTSKKFVKKLIRNVLFQCYLLDACGLDHGELSNPSKHVLLRKGNTQVEGVIIDYESASTSRKPSNLTAAAQFFLLGGGKAGKIRKILGMNEEPIRGSLRNSGLIKLLRSYKAAPSEESFERIMSFINC